MPLALLHLHLFGGFTCHRPDGGALEVRTRKARALMAYLGVHAGRFVGRDQLAALLWDDCNDAKARANLRKTLSRLRQAMPVERQAWLVADTLRISALPEALLVDVRQFERLASDATPETLEQAAFLYRGGLLLGMEACSREFESWLMIERRRLEEVAQQVFRRLLDHYTATGAIDRAIKIALRLLEQDALQENVHRQLIRLYLYQDRIGSALSQYRRCREILKIELGVEPSQETEQLRNQLMQLVPAPHVAMSPEADDLPERAAIVQAGAEDRARRRAKLGARPSIVVLALEQPRADLQGGVGEALAEEIATGLGRFRGLDVIAPGTAAAYLANTVPIEQIAVELGVAYVCTGKVRLWDQRFSITIRLIEAATARQLWAERHDGELDRLFAVQDEIASQVAATLIGRIEQSWVETARRKAPCDWQAYDFWLRGRLALRRPDLAALSEARRCFQQALAQDPSYAPAYVGLAMARLNEWACFSWNHWVFVGNEILGLVQKAVELDDHDHHAHCILAMTQLYRRDYEGCRRRLYHALDLNPNDPDVLAHAAAGLALVGDHQQALDAARKVLRIAPHRPDWQAAFAGIALFAAREHEEAIAAMASAPEALCNTPAFIAAAYAHLGEPERGVHYGETVRRHHQRQLARGLFPSNTSCLDWLLALDPFQQPADLEHYANGLRHAGF